MTVRGWLRDEETPDQMPRGPRLRVALEATGLRESGDDLPVTILNISLTGMLLHSRTPIETDAVLTVDLPRAPDTKAIVVWVSGQLHGCRFAQPLGKATLSAALLRSAVDSEGAAAPLAEAPAEPLEARLRRLRKARGLSLGEFASRLGVSKPTVWAWEKGRSSPSADRYEAIADALATTVPELKVGAKHDVALSVLDQSRTRIAEAFGVSPQSVRIMIEL